MQLALFWYVILNLVILGTVLLVVRASRAPSRPDERQDLEENTLIGADWDLVRRERCLPTGCRRAIGQPPRPRKDVTCEICAATFLEQRLRRLLDSPLSSTDPMGRPTSSAEGLPLRPRASRTASVEEARGAGSPAAASMTGAPGDQRRPRRGRAPGWAALRLGLGLVCVVVGAGLAVASAGLGLIIPGYLTVVVGLGLIAWSVASGGL